MTLHEEGYTQLKITKKIKNKPGYSVENKTKFVTLDITSFVININNFMMSTFNARRTEMFEYLISLKINEILVSNINLIKL